MVFIRLPVTVSNRLSARSQKWSEILAEFRLNLQSNLLKVFGVSLEMWSDPEKYFY